MTIYTASVEYSLNGGNTYQLYDANYTGSISSSVFTALLPTIAPGKKSAIFRVYKSGSIVDTPQSDTHIYYAGGTQMQFSSYYTVNEHKYLCVVKRSEFNKTLNPTLYDIRGSQLKLPNYNYDTSGEAQILNIDGNFSPYASSIGLYDDTNTLVAYGKFARPIKIEKDFDSVFVVKFDV